MTNLFLDVLNRYCVNRPPFWFMRQAGRVLPNYNKLREQHSFRELMSTPELAAKVTLLPVDDLGVDAAILFSDILTIPVAMGMEIEWTDKGPRFCNPLSTMEHPLEKLNCDGEKLSHVYSAIDFVVKQQRAPLIGFCGAPLTTLLYMLQGTSAKHDFPEAKKFIFRNKKETKRLVDAVTSFSIDYALKQIAHGVQAFQLFDTHAGLVPFEMYNELFMPAVKRISDAVRGKGVPFIYFPKGIGCGLESITPDICDFVSVDWQTPLSKARQMVHSEVGLQGNIDPMLLFCSKDVIAAHMEKYYKPYFAEHNDWIVNLGHGVLADTPFENLKFLADWIKETNW